jgi:thiamine pyrophosphokinase
MLTNEVIILADGLFPEHSIPLALLKSGRSIVCCDGAAMKIVAAGLEPTIIIGDLDSLTAEYKTIFSDRLVYDSDQETNDLTKAVEFCEKKGVKKVYILGATGLREDHTLGNISLLASYSAKLDVEMYTNTGYFIAVSESIRLKSYIGQQISVFSLTPQVPLTLENLKFPLVNRLLLAWWEGTLNEALGEWFGLKFTEGRFLVFLLY